MKNEIVISGGTIEGLFNDTVFGDVVNGVKIDKGTFI